MHTKLLNSIKTIYNDLYSLLFPRACNNCGTYLIDSEKFICTNCLRTLPYSNYCSIKENPLELLLRENIDIKGAASLLIYKKKTNNIKLIYLLKYYNEYNIGVYLGKIAGIEIKESQRFTDIDCIIPIPLSVKSYKERGYNQSEAISEGIASILNKDVYTDVLYRKDSRVKQSSLSFEERKTNAENIYLIKHQNKIKNKTILIVDDVITSGNTMINSIKALQKVEGVNTYVFSLASVK